METTDTIHTPISQTDTIKVQGMICRACEDAVTDSLIHCRGVINTAASYWKGQVTVEYDPAIVSREQLEKQINQSGYSVGGGGVSGLLADILCAGLVIFIVWFLLNNTLVQVPEVTESMSFGYIFLIGLLTGTHCIGMCGGILLSQTTDASDLISAGQRRSKRGLGASLAYNGGRVLSYTVLGAVFGALGAVISYSMQTKSIVFTIAGGLVALIGIGMWGIIPGFRRLSPDLPSFCKLPGKAKKRLYGKPLIIGLLTGLMPCGALYAMWVYAMSTGSPIKGALTMLVFTLGTVPLMFLFGAVNSFIPRKWMKYVLKLSAVLVVALGLKMLLKGLMLAGIF